jgi:nitrite reductase (NADH) large subunit
MNVIVIGNGISSINFIEAFRKEDTESAILVFSRESYHAYNRIWLPDAISGEKKIEDIYLKPIEWYEQNNVKVRLNTIVDKIDKGNKKVFVYQKGMPPESGEWVNYDKLVIATGSMPRKLPYDNPNVKGMFCLRTYEDVLEIQNYIKSNNCNHAAVIGGGLLGLELATSLKKLNISVTVIEIFKYLLPKQLDPEGGSILQNYLEKKGLNFVLGATVKKVLGESKVEGILLDNGRVLNTDLVFQQVGIIPEIELAKKSGLNVNNGIIVDDHLQTSDPEILAIGDCVEHKGKIYGIIPACLDQAKCAAKIVLGKPETYTGTTPKNMLKVAGISMMSIGTINASDIPNLAEYYHENRDEFLYRKGLVSGNTLVGAILLGKFDVGYFNKKMNKEVDVEELNKYLSE